MEAARPFLLAAHPGGEASFSLALGLSDAQQRSLRRHRRQGPLMRMRGPPIDHCAHDADAWPFRAQCGKCVLVHPGYLSARHALSVGVWDSGVEAPGSSRTTCVCVCASRTQLSVLLHGMPAHCQANRFAVAAGARFLVNAKGCHVNAGLRRWSCFCVQVVGKSVCNSLAQGKCSCGFLSPVQLSPHSQAAMMQGASHKAGMSCHGVQHPLPPPRAPHSA